MSLPKIGNSNPQIRELFDINLRLVYELHSIGKIVSSANLFCAVLNLPKSLAKFPLYYEHIVSATVKVAKNSMIKGLGKQYTKMMVYKIFV